MIVQERSIYSAVTPIYREHAERFFALSWDNSKSRRIDSAIFQRQHARGLRWRHGAISLDNGYSFPSYAEMARRLQENGVYSVVWEE
jgi:hypothetical protein